MKSRIFQGLRLLVCLVLICALVINISPIKAEAVVGELVAGAISTAPVWVPVATAAASILVALGVMASADRTSFNTTVNDVVTYLETSTTYVVNGMVAVWGVFGADQITRSYVLKDMIQDVWCWLFDNGHVSSAVPLPNDVISSSAINEARSHAYNFYAELDYGTFKEWVLCYSDSYPITFSSGYLISANTTTFYFIGTASPVWKTTTGITCGGLKNISIKSQFGYDDPEYIASDGLVLGQIQAPPESKQLEDAEVYTDYITKIEFCPDGRPDYGEDKKEHLPLGFPPTDHDDQIMAGAQEYIQSGENDLDFDFETTDPDTGTGEPGTGTDPGTDSGSGSWSPPNDMGKFTLDLKDYFPFCIPFDLYDFASCLNAEPETPHFVFDVPFPYMDEPWHIDIDFSIFDPIAKTLRILELLLFCVGLAFKTRDLIKG